MTPRFQLEVRRTRSRWWQQDYTYAEEKEIALRVRYPSQWSTTMDRTGDGEVRYDYVTKEDLLDLLKQAVGSGLIHLDMLQREKREERSMCTSNGKTVKELADEVTKAASEVELLKGSYEAASKEERYAASKLSDARNTLVRSREALDKKLKEMGA